MSESESLVERVAQILNTQHQGDTDPEALTRQAREIVAALRQPTRAMARAGADVPVGCCMTNASDAGAVWDYMIDAALAEQVAARFA